MVKADLPNGVRQPFREMDRRVSLSRHVVRPRIFRPERIVLRNGLEALGEGREFLGGLNVAVGIVRVFVCLPRSSNAPSRRLA